LKILVRFPNWLGDVVFARGFLKALAEKYPEAKVHILIKKNLKELVWDYPCFTFENKRDLLKLCSKIKKEKFDICYILPISFSSAFFTFLYGIPERIGYSKEARGIFLTKSFKIKKDYRKKHIINSYLKLLGLSYEEKYSPELPLPASGSKKLFKKYVVFAPFANYGPSKEWSYSHYIELGNIFEKKGYKVIIVGAKGEKRKFDKWDKKFEDFVGKLSLIEVAYLIKNSDLFIGNDSGLFHLSNALDKESIGIYGSSSPVWTGPLGKKGRYIYKAIFCSPCFKRNCIYNKNKYECLYSIKPEEVFELAKKLIEL